MRIAATAATLLFALASCSTTESTEVDPYQQPNGLMSGEINRRIQQIPYQHRDELLENLLWLAQTGEQTIPALLHGLDNDSPKVRSSCAWVLGRLGDRRVIGRLQATMQDREPGVQLEAARSLVLMGDLQHAPKLIEGLDSDRTEVRYLCHEALKTSTGHDYGYDHLGQDQQQRQVAVLQWRQWWGDYSGDTFFAKNYQQQHDIGAQLAAPAGEMKPTMPAGNTPATQPGGNVPAGQPPVQPVPTNAMPNQAAQPPPTGAGQSLPPAMPAGETGKPAMPTGSGAATPIEVPSNQPAGEPKPAQPTTGKPKPVIQLPVIKAKPSKGEQMPAKPTANGNGGGNSGSGL